MRYAMGRWLGVIAVLALWAATCAAADEMACPRIPDDGYPAFVFVEGTNEQSALYVARFADGKPQREQIVAAGSDQVWQLADAMFLLEGTHDGQAGLFVIDLARGRMRHIGSGSLLRSVPERGKAMLFRRYVEGTELELVELDLDTLETKRTHVLSQKTLGDDFPGLWSNLKISPDFQRLAFATIKGGLPGVHEPAVYVLKALDLSTRKTTVVDDNVQVRIGAFSSLGHGRPAFEWLSDDEIIYQHVAGNGELINAEHVLKIADLKAGTTREVMRQLIRMTMDGGSLDRDPASGRLEYNREYVIDLEGKALLGRDHPFSVEQTRDPTRTTVRRAETVVFDEPGWAIGTCLSPSGKHFAFMVRPPVRPEPRELHSVIYAILDGQDTPIIVGDGPYLPTRPIGWAEKPHEAGRPAGAGDQAPSDARQPS